MKTPPPARYEGRPSDAQRIEAARGYLAYFGTYDINYATMTITHKVEDALNLSHVNTARDRAITITGTHWNRYCQS